MMACEGGIADFLCLKNMKKNMDEQVKMKESEIQAVLACHLFSPLVTDCEVISDLMSYSSKTSSSEKQSGGSAKVHCPFCKKEVVIGNTNFGCKKLWHGRADIVIKTKDLKKIHVVTLAAETEEEVGQGEPAATKTKQVRDVSYSEDSQEGSTSTLVRFQKNFDLWYSFAVAGGMVNQILSEKANKQAISQTIVNAFLAVKQNGSFEDRLIPSFFTTGQCIFINFYNVKKDILLVQSKPLFFFKVDGINFHTIITLWMALNFEKFHSYFVDSDVYYEKSGFKDHLIELNEMEVEYGFSSVCEPEQTLHDFYVDPANTVRLLSELKNQADID